MKTLIIILSILFTFSVYAQEQRSIADRVKQNVTQQAPPQQTQQQMGGALTGTSTITPNSNSDYFEEEDVSLQCPAKIARYTDKVAKFKGLDNLTKYQSWQLKFYTNRLRWWNKFCKSEEE